MSAADRRNCFRKHAPALVLITIVYLLITILRNVRSDFAKEIWLGLTGSITPADLSIPELYISLGVTALIGLGVLIKQNQLAFHFAMLLSLLGATLLGVSYLALRAGQIDAYLFMILCGFGLYLPYIAVQTILFERFIAMTRERGNIGFLIYLVDSYGYLGYVAVLFIRHLTVSYSRFIEFFLPLVWIVSIFCVVLLIPSWYFFMRSTAIQSSPSVDT
jgi:hypothetical protein